MTLRDLTLKSIEALPRAVSWSDGKLSLLDQRRLPVETQQIRCDQIEDVFDAIKTLAVRGAPAIGIAAAYGLLVGLPDPDNGDVSALRQLIQDRANYLKSARPTAVNLAWAVDRMLAALLAGEDDTIILKQCLLAEAMLIHREDTQACNRIGDYGLPLVQKCPRVLTHCNAGSLAVSELGTALAPIYKAYEAGVPVHVYIDETRPLLQGARLTAFELHATGVDCTLITDNMAAHIMSRGLVDMVLVGTDRVAANGDVANKIGTLNLAVLCHYFGIPFYVACPVSTIDLATASGSEIRIEQRSGSEVTQLGGQQLAPTGIGVLNPAFDITPARLVSGIITECGVIRAPFESSLAGVVTEKYASASAPG